MLVEDARLQSLILSLLELELSLQRFVPLFDLFLLLLLLCRPFICGDVGEYALFPPFCLLYPDDVLRLCFGGLGGGLKSVSVSYRVDITE